MKNKMTTLAASAGLLMGATGLAQADGSKLDSVKTTLSSILAKEGISFSGEFRSEFHQATIDDARLDNTVNPTTESVEYTSVDFDITARPNSNVSGHAIIRMHQDWRNFFSDLSNPIHTRWLSIDGNFGDILIFNLGDFRTKYSPLTVWAQEENVMYEADIFAQDRREAQKEYFIGDNLRMMQGVNLQVDAEVSGVLDEAHFGIFGSRLRNVKPESKVTNENEVAKLEKFAFGTNFDLSLKGGAFGASYLSVFDRKSTYRGADGAASLLERDLLAEDLSVIAVRAGFDLNKKDKGTNAIFSANAEYAMGSDNVGFLANAADTVASTQGLDGNALLVTLKGGYKSGKMYKAVATVNYMKNDRDFYNPLAQSPTVEMAQVMNVESDVNFEDGTVNGDMWSNHYSIYDNFHNHVYKFAPSSETNLWHKAPYTKNGYTNETFTRRELAAFPTIYGYNGFKPAGLATANRAGVVANVKVDFLDEAGEAKIIVEKLEDAEGAKYEAYNLTDGSYMMLEGTAKAKYSIVGGGAKVDVMKLTGKSKPLVVSLSYIMKTLTRDAETVTFIDGQAFTASNANTEIAYTNLGLYYAFWNRFALMGGFQVSDIKNKVNNLNWKETATAAGIEYKLASGLYTVLKYTKLDVDKTVASYSQDFVNAAIRVQF